MSARRLLYQVAHPILNFAARNRFLIRRLFRLDIPRDVTVHFDPTTLLLHMALQDVVVPQDTTALEVGIGQGGSAWRWGCGVRHTWTCRESIVLRSRVASSQCVAHHNGLAADFFVSDLFSAVPPDRRYDLIFFNPPYVPTSVGKQLKLTDRMRADSDRVWDGGQDGTLVLRDFLLHAPSHLSRRGRVLFGVQPMFVSDNRIRELVEQTHLTMLNRITRCCIPSVVYVLGHTAATAGSEPAVSLEALICLRKSLERCHTQVPTPFAAAPGWGRTSMTRHRLHAPCRD